MTEGPSTLILIGLIMVIAALPTTLVIVTLIVWLDRLELLFIPMVLIIIGATIAFAGAI